MPSLDAIGLAIVVVMGGVWLFTTVQRYLGKVDSGAERARRRKERRTDANSDSRSRSRSYSRSGSRSYSRRRSRSRPRRRRHITLADEYASERFSDSILRFVPIDFKLLRDMEIVANDWQSYDEQVLRWRKSQLGVLGFNTAAGSIYATVAASALRLEYLRNTHWTATAFLFAGLVTSTLSVYVASIVQRDLSMLIRPKDIRYWLTARIIETDGGLLNESSLWTAALLQAPLNLIRVSIQFTLLGITQYLIYSYINNTTADWGPDGHRNILITTLTIAGSIIFGFGLFFGFKWVDTYPIETNEIVKRDLRRPDLPESYELIRSLNHLKGSLEKNTKRQKELNDGPDPRGRPVAPESSVRGSNYPMDPHYNHGNTRNDHPHAGSNRSFSQPDYDYDRADSYEPRRRSVRRQRHRFGP